MSIPNILVIDDDPAIRKLLYEVLSSKQNYNVIVAEGGAEAARFFYESKIDVVLTDIHTPGSTSLGVVNDIKRAQFPPEILVMTASATEENVAKARKLGARSLILKPFDDLSILETEIEKAVKAAAASEHRRPEKLAVEAPQSAPIDAPPAPRATQPATTAQKATQPEPARTETPQPVAPETKPLTAPQPLPSSQIPADLVNILRTATTLAADKLGLQVPVICLQTAEEREAIDALRPLAKQLNREFYVWSAAKGLVGSSGVSLGEIYNEPLRALEFIRHQQQPGIFVLVDFRPFLEDAQIVRTLREMVIEGQTARLSVVLTAPLFLVPPELEPSSARFDWPAAERIDHSLLIDEVRSALEQNGNRPRTLSGSETKELLGKLKGLPVARARFEIARCLLR